MPQETSPSNGRPHAAGAAPKGNGAKGRTAPTLHDKVTFTQWAAREHRLSGSEHRVLEAVVRVLGLDGARPHNGWATNGVLATDARVAKRTVRRALLRLEACGLLKRTSLPGRGGRICLHVAGIHDAAVDRKADPLGDRTADMILPKMGQNGPVLAPEKGTGWSSESFDRIP